MSQFIGRVIHYLVGEALVNGLANSKLFQRFAVRTDAALKTHKATVQKHSDKIMEHAVKKGETFVSTAKTNISAKQTSTEPGLFGNFGRFVSHLGNEIKKDVAGNVKK